MSSVIIPPLISGSVFFIQNKWYNPFGSIVRWWTKSNWSHCGLVTSTPSEFLEDAFILEATLLGTKKGTLRKYLGNKRLIIYTPKRNRFNYNQGDVIIFETENKDKIYALPGTFIGIPLTRILNLKKNFIKWGQNCVELCLKFLRSVVKDLDTSGYDHNSMYPSELFKYIHNNENYLITYEHYGTKINNQTHLQLREKPV